MKRETPNQILSRCIGRCCRRMAPGSPPSGWHRPHLHDTGARWRGAGQHAPGDPSHGCRGPVVPLCAVQGERADRERQSVDRLSHGHQRPQRLQQVRPAQSDQLPRRAPGSLAHCRAQPLAHRGGESRRPLQLHEALSDGKGLVARRLGLENWQVLKSTCGYGEHQVQTTAMLPSRPGHWASRHEQNLQARSRPPPCRGSS